MNTLVTQTVSHFQPPILMLMVAGGIGGGMIGRRLRRVDDRMVERMFLILMAVIIGISLSLPYILPLTGWTLTHSPSTPRRGS